MGIIIEGNYHPRPKQQKEYFSKIFDNFIEYLVQFILNFTSEKLFGLFQSNLRHTYIYGDEITVIFKEKIFLGATDAKLNASAFASVSASL